MECISELQDSLNAYFGWNKARMRCFVNTLLSLFATRTVNLNKLACVVFGEAQQSSRFRRIQRFFSKFPLDYKQIAGFITKKVYSKDLLKSIKFIAWFIMRFTPMFMKQSLEKNKSKNGTDNGK
jgi:hypothetical protein